MRIFVAGIWHETNTFATLRAERRDFESYCLVEGAALLDSFANTNTEIGGAISQAASLGIALVPGLFAGALPSGPCSQDLFREFVERIAAGAAAAHADGALLALHGAMVAEGANEADAIIIEAVRRATACRIPLAVTFDLHANLSDRVVAAADLLVGYRTNPHVDMAERGAEALRLLADMVSNNLKLFSYLAKVPAVSVSQTQVVADEPMRSIMRARDRVASTPGIISASVGIGYPYADVPQLGMAALVYGLDAAGAAAGAQALASEIWNRRSAFVPIVEPVQQAIRRARSIAKTSGRPVILVDVGDNIGGGTPGDGTVALDALLGEGIKDAAVVLWDPPAVRTAVSLGQGAFFNHAVGGHTDASHGPPISIRGEVAYVTESLSYRRGGSWMTGQQANHGAVARIAVAGSSGAHLNVVLTERRIPPYDLDHLTLTGLVVEQLTMIVVKAAAGWRVAFEPVMSAAIYLDTPGVHAADLSQFPFRHRPMPLYPFETDAQWPVPRVANARSFEALS